MNALAGQLIKGYELQDVIDTGAFGAVYRALQPVVGREVAVKIIRPEYASHPDFIRRFEVEAQLVARLEHPYIVPLYDYWRDPGGAYLVMRWLRGGNLHSQLVKGTLPLEDVDRLLTQIGSALSTAHRRGVVHRDLKPGNILLDEEGNFFLADFGIAKDVGKGHLIYQTMAGTVVGSPAYLSPEQIESQMVTAQTDIYSLGVMLYEILTGHLPFESATPVGFYFKHIHEPVPPLDLYRPDLPQALNKVIQRATAKMPSQRHPDVQSLIEDFRRALIVDESAVPSKNGSGKSNGVNPHATVRLPLNGKKTRAVEQKSTAAVPLENPYKGLRAFQEADAADFFGRQMLIQHLLASMDKASGLAHFLAVVGPSGGGKSSVVRAGLIPALRRGALTGSDRWFIADILPGARPMEEVATALTRVATHVPANLLEQLLQNEYGLLHVLKQILPDSTELLLVIDQFEEVFTLVEDEATRVHFLNSLLAAVTAPGSGLRVIVTLRADFYDRPLLYPGFSELIRRRTEVVIPLSAEEVREAIVLPAERVGVAIEPNLVATIVRDVAEQPGTLPLLQYVLTELFETRNGSQITLTAYQSSGGVLGALARRADDIYQGLDKPAQEAAEQLFLRLVTLGEGNEDTRRRVTQTELASIGEDPQVLKTVIDAYCTYRLLTLDHDPISRIPTVEVAHEALIRRWSRLRKWLDASRDDLRTQRRLASAASDWIAAGRDPEYLAVGGRLDQVANWAKETHLVLNQDEQAYLQASIRERDVRDQREAERKQREVRLEKRSRQVMRTLVTVSLIAALIMTGLAGVAYDRSQAAQQSASAAQKSAVEASAARTLAEKNAEEANDQREKADELRIEAEAARKVAIAQREDARKQAISSDAQAALSGGNIDQALALGLAANEKFESPLPRAQYTLAQAAYRGGTQKRLSGHTNGVLAIAINQDGTQALTGSRDETVILWDLTTGQRIHTLNGHSATILDVAFSPDGVTALSTGGDETIIWWNLKSGQMIRKLEGHDNGIQAVMFFPDGQRALSGSEDTTLIAWDLNTGSVIRTFTGHTQVVEDLVISADGNKVYSVGGDQLVHEWDANTGQLLRTWKGHNKQVNGVTLTSDGKMAATSDADGKIILWDVTTGEAIKTLLGHSRDVYKLAFSPDNSTLISSSRDTSVGVWNVASGTGRFLNGHGAGVEGAVFHPRKNQALTVSHDATIRIWDLDNGAQVRRLDGTPELRHEQRVIRALWSPDGKTVLSGAGDGSMILWDAATGQPIHKFVGHNEAVAEVEFTPDGKYLVSASTDKTILTWDLQSREVAGRFDGHAKEVSALSVSPDSSKMLTGDGEGVIILWDIAAQKEIRRMTGHNGKVNGITFSPDGKTALSAGRDTTLILWNVDTGKPEYTFRGHSAAVRAVTFSHDGTQALSGAEDYQAILWDLKARKEIRRFVEHRTTVWDVAFNHDSTMIATGSEDMTAIVWDLASGQAVRRFEGHTAAVRSVAFSDDGKLLLTGSNDFSMRIWRVDTLPELITWARANRYIPELSKEQIELYGFGPQADLAVSQAP